LRISARRPDPVGPFAICAEIRAKNYQTELRFAETDLLARTPRESVLRKTARERANVRSRTERSNVKTAGEMFADGTLIELVQRASVPNKPNLLLWNGTEATIAPRVQYAGRSYEATELIASVGSATRLPSGCCDYASVRELFTAIASLFTRHLGLPEREARLLAYFSISTWFADCLPTAPGAAIYGPVQGQGTDILRLLNCVCRRPLMLADVTPPGLRSLPMCLHPTLLINQPGLSPRMWTLLRTSSQHGLYVPAGKGGVLDLHGASAVFLGADDVLKIAGGEVLHLSLPPTLFRFTLDDARLAQIASELQPKLLTYRLMNWRKVQESEVDFSAFTFPTRELARNLGACVADDPELAQELSSLLEMQDADARAQHYTDIRYVIIEIILLLLHTRETSALRVQKIAESTNALLRSRGEIVEYSAAEIGWKLRQLGLSRSRDGAGKSLFLHKETSRRIHELAGSYGVLARENLRPGCPDCAKAAQPVVVS